MHEEETKRLEEKADSGSMPLQIETFDLRGKKYNVSRVLSETSSEAQVYLLEAEGKNYVLKLYYPNFSPKPDLLEVLRNIDSKFLVHLYDYGFLLLGTSTRCYELMEYLDGGNLEDYILNQDENRFREIALAAASALDDCHRAGIIHRDVKLSNFFFRGEEKKDIILGDFGISSLSKEDEELHKTTQARTPIYAAPEMYMQVIDGEVELTSRIDYYSLGITLLYLWFGKNPFTGNERLIMQQKSEGKLPGIDQLPPSVSMLIRGLTIVNPEYRWGYEEVERWYNGENVPVSDDIPMLRYKKFLFDPEKELIARNARDMAELIKNDRNLGIKYLYNKRISKWLEDSENRRLAVEIDEIIEKYFPIDQAAGVIAAIYILDRNQPFLLNSIYPSSTPEEIVKAFAANRVTPDDYKALIDGRLVLWLSNKDYPDLYEEISALTAGKIYSEGLAYGVLYHLDKKCGYNLGQEYTTPQEIARLMSQILLSIQNASDMAVYSTAIDAFIGEQGRLYYYCLTHDWKDILDYREIGMSQIEETVGEYNLPVACYQFCARMGYSPGYLFPKSQKIIYSLEELNEIPEREIKQEFRNGKIKEWLAIFYYAKAFDDFYEEYSYEKSLGAYLEKLDQYNISDLYAKRFFMAKERVTDRQKKLATSIRIARIIDIACNATFAFVALLLIFFIARYGIDDPELFIKNYFYHVCLPIVLCGAVYSGIKAFHLSTGVIVSIVSTVLGGVISVVPAALMYWLFTTFPERFSFLLLILVVFYVVVILFLGVMNSSKKILKLKSLTEDNIQLSLIEPLSFAYSSTASKHKSSNEKDMNEAFDTVTLTRRKLVTYYSVWITLGIYFLLTYVCFNSNFAGFNAPEITWDSIKYFFRIRNNP